MPTIQEQIQVIQERYRPQIEDLERRGQRLADDFREPNDVEGAVDVQIEVEWKNEDLIFDIPSVTMRTTTIALDIPEVQSQRQTIKFHTPSVRMVNKKVGQYPEFHGFRVKWKDIIISVPEQFMEEQTIIFDLPSVSMKRHEIKLDIPEFRMEKVKWVLKLPQFKVIRVSAEAAKVKEAGEQLQAEGQQIASRMKLEIEAVVGSMNATSAHDRFSAKNDVAAGYDEAIAKLKSTIDELIAKGIDPIKVPTEGGDINLRKQLAELIAQREATLAKIDQNSPDLPLAA